jgi:serine/threonine protein kinase
MSEVPSLFDALSEEALRRLDGVCCRFERAWQDGQTPRLEDALAALSDAERPAFLRELLRLEVYYRRRAGEGPCAADYETRFPEATAVLGEVFALPGNADLPRPMPETVDDLPHGGPEQAAATTNTDTPAAVSAAAEDVPTELADHPRYRVVRRLGGGGMGTVYEVEHRVMQRRVALKVIKRAYLDSPAAVERFRREVRAAARLSHPNIVTAFDAEHAGDTHFLVMEYVEGTTLGRLVQQGGPLPVAQACDYVRQAALGLQHAHRKGMVHRDVKPDNLMLTPDGTVKVLDFGLASLTADSEASGLSHPDAIMGTPDYMAPEQAQEAHTADNRADVYSLGCTLYYLLTGEVPYPASTTLRRILAHRERPVPPVRGKRPDVLVELAAVVARLLAKKPKERYQTCGELAAALAPFATIASPAPLKGHRRLIAALAASLLVGLSVVGLVVAFILWRPGPGVEGEHTQPTSVAPKGVSPADLARLTPVIDEDWSKRPPDWRVVPDTRYKISTRSDEGALTCRFDQLPGYDDWRRFRRWPYEPGSSFFNCACCLTGRVSAGENTAFTVCLFGPEEHVLGVHAHSSGVLDVGPAQNSPQMRLPQVVGSWRELAHPDSESNDLLVILQNRRLRVFVNNRECNLIRSIVLPDDEIPVLPRFMAYCWGPDKARVDFIRWRVWDLDHPVAQDQKTRENE